ncbi:MAG: hypothetical protein KAS32_08385 [Candidatus Peribacteraceae bacterium]|nr:hypothetical protein [Candidatus Peribacteraceae bacterium]
MYREWEVILKVGGKKVKCIVLALNPDGAQQAAIARSIKKFPECSLLDFEIISVKMLIKEQKS